MSLCYCVVLFLLAWFFLESEPFLDVLAKIFQFDNLHFFSFEIDSLHF